MAARFYAQTQASFEEIALKFIQVEEKPALRMFLLKKLDSLKGQVRLFNKKNPRQFENRQIGSQ